MSYIRSKEILKAICRFISLCPKWSIYPKQIFFQNYLYHSDLPIGSFHSAKFKKNYSSRSRVMMCNFWAPNGPFPQMRIFSENLLISLASLIHAYLNAKNH